MTTDVKKQPPRRAAMPRIFFTYCDCYCYYYYVTECAKAHYASK